MATKNNILIKLSESKNTKFGKEDFALQSTPQKVFSAIWAAQSEVCNGGFAQYFLNSSSETAWFVTEAFSTIGALKTADICSRAIKAAFPAGLLETPESVSSAAQNFSPEILKQLGSLDDEFFGSPDDVTGLLFAFVSGDPDEFGTLSTPDDA